MKSFRYALKELREAVGATTTLDKPVALLREILEIVQSENETTEQDTEENTEAE